MENRCGRRAISHGVLTAILAATAAQEAIAGSPRADAQAEGQASPPAVSDTSAPTDANAAIVVTGTRLRSGLTTPTPVTMSSAEQLHDSNPGLLGQALAQLPEFRGSSTASSSTQSPQRDNGANFLNLRGLGVQRTLVLLDGRRFVSSSSSGIPDVNLFPQDLVQRVEIVTGGASAAYGSDAVAGVVNFVLDKTFTGIRLTSQAGLSQYKDDGLKSGTLTAGTSFGGGNGHIIANVEYFKQDGIQANSGRRVVDGRYGLASSGVASPSLIIAAPFNFQIPYGGLITSGPLANMRFLPGSGVAPFDFGTNRSSGQQVGGDGASTPFDPTAATKRYAAFSRAQYQMGNVTLYGEGSYAQSTTQYNLIYPQQGITATGYTIFAGNAFLPSSVAAALGATPSFTMKRISRDFGSVHVDTRSRTYRAIAGLDWDMGSGWKLSAYYMHGQNEYRNAIHNDVNRRNLYAAADAVTNPANGQIVCRSTLQGLDPGCVPIDLFGEGAPSRAALNYVLGTSIAKLKLKEDVASAVINGSPFALPAGPFDIAAGVEYRREAGVQRDDSITTSVVSGTGVRGVPASLLTGVTGGFEYNNALPFAGHYDIKEGFVEANAPILKDVPFVHSLSLNGAVRVIDYSTAGTVLTWKAGASYEPFADLRFRATRSRDIRAANLAELFTGLQPAPSLVVYHGVSTPVLGLRSGNPNLKPEKADTLTAGFVYRPSFIPGLGVSVDYYKIDMTNAIQQLTNQQTADFCANGSSISCAQISFDASGQLNIATPTLNLASIKNSGVDFELDYNRRVGGTTLGVRGLLGYLAKQVTKVSGGGAPIDRAGDIGVSGLPHWTGSLQLTAARGPISGFIQERFVGGGKIDNTLTPAQLANNHVGAVFYTDVTLKDRIVTGSRNSLDLYVTINNLFARNPPIAPNSPFGVYRSTNPTVYDIVGRYITVGAKVEF
jgi:outer membrane receptor protein involved in Fe transport